MVIPTMESELRMTLMQLSEIRLELAAVTEQRRLAEAIRKHKFDDVKLWQALQSLNQPTEL